ncbi:MAG: serine/threonine-protein phosphatase [Candidatus Promineofilum sp.]|nr:serine/threonine-protein phosphatase [Promineifilum sp.]
MTKLVTGLAFDIGQRDIYEDRVVVRRITTRSQLDITVALVADGVGGANRGERAAQLAVDVALHYLENGSTAQDVPRLLDEAFMAANQAVLDEREATMGASTTLAAAVVHEDRLFVANTGDSRVYLCRGRALTQLTIDHNFANVIPWTGTMSAAAAAINPRAAVLMHYLGQRAQPHVDHGFYGDAQSPNGAPPTTDPRAAHERGMAGLPLRPGDAVIVCSDGLVKPAPSAPAYVSADEIARVLGTQVGDRAARSLVSFALGRDADDNVSVGLIQWPGRRSRGRPLLTFLTLTLLVGLAALWLWRAFDGQRQTLQGQLAAQQAQATQAAAAAATTRSAEQATGTATTTSGRATADALAAATATAEGQVAATRRLQAATATADAAVGAVATARAAQCALAGNYGYEVRRVTLTPETIRYTIGDPLPQPIAIAARWLITNTGVCPLVVEAIYRTPATGDEPLPVAFERDGAVLAALPPGESAELVALLGEIATFDELAIWRDLYRSKAVRWEPAIAPAGEASAFRPINQPLLPLNSATQGEWIILTQPTATPTRPPTITPTPTPPPTAAPPPPAAADNTPPPPATSTPEP